MPIFRLDKAALFFPPPALAEPGGLLAVGGDFRPERLLLAYSMGIFPWSEYRGQPLWYSPDPRLVLTPDGLRVQRSLAKILRRGDFEVRLDTAFADVVDACAAAPRPGQDGTWISPRYRRAFLALHARGLAHSAEAWRDGVLLGGVYGLCLGGAFFGESMFARASNASKVAFVTLVRELEARGIGLIDCQVETEHLRRFGAVEWPRDRFLRALSAVLGEPTHVGPWALTVGKVTG